MHERDIAMATPEEEAELERAKGKLTKNDLLHRAGITQTLEDVTGRSYVPSRNGHGGDPL